MRAVAVGRLMPAHDALAKRLRSRGWMRLHRAYIWSLRMAILARDTRPRDAKERRWARRILRLYPRKTMVGPRGLLNACEVVDRVEAEGVPGAVVECGVWRGGCSALMASVLHDHGSSRVQWLVDSFEGLPAASPQDEEDARELARGRFDGELEPVGGLGVDQQAVRALVEAHRRDPSRVRVLRGWFQETLPKGRGDIGPIAVLRLDGDWYDSTMTCLVELYDQVSPGGFVIIDDYGALEGCRRAVADFFARRNEPLPPIAMADGWVGYFRKVTPAAGG